MTLIDLIIIYLAVGAPFGVYYFLQNRSRQKSGSHYFKTLLNFLFWIPCAFFLLRQNKKLVSETLAALQKRIEKILPPGNLIISVYDFREIVERYAGLTLFDKNSQQESVSHESEIFSISESKNAELGSICLARRNRKKLSAHQTEARKDFLRLIRRMLKAGADKNNLQLSTIELVKFLKDEETRIELEKIFAESLQITASRIVQNLENDLWKPERPEPILIKPISFPLQTLKATTNSRKKD